MGPLCRGRLPALWHALYEKRLLIACDLDFHGRHEDTRTVTDADTTTPSKRSAWISLMPGVFVILWATGFIGAKLGLPYAEPMTFLAWRFSIVASVLFIASLVVRAPWPRSWKLTAHIAVAGLLLHGAYLGGVFASIGQGVPAGVSALIVGIQPLLVAAVAGPLLGERVSRLQWLGLLLGLAGIALVVWNKLSLNAGTPFGMALSVFALLGITLGTVYQKKFCGGMDLRSGNAIQFAATAIVMWLLAMTLETMVVQWTGQFIFAMAWLVIVLSFGAITLLLILIRRGAAAKVASLFYMVPPCTALFAWLLFGETLDATALSGMGLVVIGVAMINIRT